MNEEAFRKALSGVRIPVLVLDQKWHRLFAISGKPEEVADLEKKERDLLARQGQLNEDLKALKKVKKDLMDNIVHNISDQEAETVANDEKKMTDDKRLIQETNDKAKAIEDELIDLPKEISDTNKDLMLFTMQYCYGKLRSNEKEAGEISAWIKNFRIELKKNIIRKQNRIINNREIYSYMHDIFGKDVIDLFDVSYEEEKKEEEKEKGKEKKDHEDSPDSGPDEGTGSSDNKRT